MAAYLRVVNPRTNTPYACSAGAQCPRQHPRADVLGSLDATTFTNKVTKEWRFPEPMRTLCLTALAVREAARDDKQKSKKRNN